MTGRDASKTGRRSRRHVLQTLGAIGIGSVAGCSSNNTENEPTTSGRPSGSGSTTTAPSPTPEAGGSFACADLRTGSQTFAPDGRAFQVIWDYPETFVDVERELVNTEQMAGARLGHAATKTSGMWPFMIQINQILTTVDEDGATGFTQKPGYEMADPIEYEGQSIARGTASMGDNHVWDMAIPADEDGRFYPLSVTGGVEGDEYADCADAFVSVVEGIMQSFRPNPA